MLHKLFSVLLGGKSMANALSIKDNEHVCHTREHSKGISDWEEMQMILSSKANEKGLTKSDSRKILQRVRQMNDSNSRY
jgi:hypothetical protein